MSGVYLGTRKAIEVLALAARTARADPAAYLAGRDRVDAATRWDELQPAYQDLGADVS